MQNILPNNRLIGSNTLRFVVQDIVKRETGLSSHFTVQSHIVLDHILNLKKLEIVLDQILTLKKLEKVSSKCTDGLLPC